MIVRVGPVDDARFIGRQAGPAPARFCCDFTSYPTVAHAQLPGIVQLFHNKRAAARRLLPPCRTQAAVHARYTYYWSDFTFNDPASVAPDSFAADPALARAHAPVLKASDPITHLALSVLWDPFHVTAVQYPDSADGASVAAPAHALVLRRARAFQLAPPRDIFGAAVSSANPTPYMPFASAARACLRLAHKAAAAPGNSRPAAPRPLIDIPRAAAEAAAVGAPGPDVSRILSSQSTPALPSAKQLAAAAPQNRAAGPKNSYSTADTPSSSAGYQSEDARAFTTGGSAVLDGNAWRLSSPPELALHDFVSQVSEYCAAAVLEDEKLDEEYLIGGVASLFGIKVGPGPVEDVVDALGSDRAELSAVERIFRLIVESNSTSFAHRLWGLFLDGVELHWEKRWVIPGVEFDPAVGPSQGNSLLVQKLEMLNCCMHRLHDNRARASRSGNDFGRNKRLWPYASSGASMSQSGSDVSVDGGSIRRPLDGDADSAGPSPRASVLDGDSASSDADCIQNGGNVNDFLWEPAVQAHPYVTRDMVEAEQTKIVKSASELHGGKNGTGGKRQAGALRSDMMAFKAANPNSTMEDFVRWFSPTDWTAEEAEETTAGPDESGDEESTKMEEENGLNSAGKVDSEATSADGRRRSGRLSVRMCSPGNMWKEMWDSAKPLPAAQQVPLFDPHLHGVKALSDLRTMPLKEVIRQLACVHMSYTLRILHRAFDRPAKVSSVVVAIASARQSVMTCQTLFPVGDAEGLAMLADTCDKLGRAEHMAVGAASLARKLPLGVEFSSVISSLVAGEVAEITDERQKSTLSVVCAMEEDGWRTPIVPTYREFRLEESDGDRMQVKLSSEQFRVGVRLGMEYTAS